LQDLHFPRPGEITHTKDPEVFRAILIDRIENQQEYRDFW
jgi:homoserine kinase type II